MSKAILVPVFGVLLQNWQFVKKQLAVRDLTSICCISVGGTRRVL